MKTTSVLVLPIAFALWGCSAGPGATDASPGGTADAQTVAYGFSYRFTLPETAVGAAQDRHMALCDGMGPARCRMQEMHRSTGDSASGGSIRFAVIAAEARRFGQALSGPVGALGGVLASRDFEAEDLSAQKAETQARVAERPNVDNRVAQAAVRERLAMSSVRVAYDGTRGFGEQVGGALGAAGETLTTSIVMLIYFLAAALPWALVLGGLFLVVRTVARRTRRLFPRADRGPAPIAGGS